MPICTGRIAFTILKEVIHACKIMGSSDNLRNACGSIGRMRANPIVVKQPGRHRLYERAIAKRCIRII